MLEPGAISELFVAIADYAGARGIKGPGLLEFDGPEGLQCKLNATPDEKESIPPYACAILCRGWPVAVVNPYGGDAIQIAEWDEDKLIAAFKAGITQENVK